MEDNELKTEDDSKNQKDVQNIKENTEISGSNKTKEVTERDLMNIKTLFCIDASESVRGNITYHNVIRNLFNKFYKNGDLIWLWGSSAKKMTESEFRAWNNSKESGLGGTSSDLIADILNNERNSGVEHLIIITQSCANPYSIDKSETKMKNYNIHLKFVSNYIISSSYCDQSVGAPYCRGYPSATYVYYSENNCEKLSSLSKADIDLIQNLMKMNINDKFNPKYDELKDIMEAKMYGRENDLDLINKLEIMKKNILSKTPEKKTKG